MRAKKVVLGIVTALIVLIISFSLFYDLIFLVAASGGYLSYLQGPGYILAISAGLGLVAVFAIFIRFILPNMKDEDSETLNTIKVALGLVAALMALLVSYGLTWVIILRAFRSQ